MSSLSGPNPHRFTQAVIDSLKNKLSDDMIKSLMDPIAIYVPIVIIKKTNSTERLGNAPMRVTLDPSGCISGKIIIDENKTLYLECFAGDIVEMKTQTTANEHVIIMKMKNEDITAFMFKISEQSVYEHFYNRLNWMVSVWQK